MSGAQPNSIESLVPHTGEIVLLDSLVTVSQIALSARTTVRADGLFNTTPERVPSFIAVEYMAQAMAAWAGHHGLARGEPVRPGLLLGVRDYVASAPYMPVGEALEVTVRQVLETPAGTAVFDAEVTGQTVHITARLSVLTVESLEDLKRLSSETN